MAYDRFFQICFKDNTLIIILEDGRNVANLL